MSPPCRKDLYEETCKPRFDGIDGSLREIHEAICGDEAENRPGLGERVRRLEGRARWTTRLLLLILGSIITALARELVVAMSPH
jgi:hypothetical protein